ncbi:hypothetical protein TWF569_009366 [Orbilia oligospora]|uniref:Fucose-specific lectin n=2 Tax=Orbilia oligospora TaxID=2813651 RepID=A0A7C8N5Z1_ORBOL|nr:hypothetical protein TWF102_011662 [Orbilia oligospora]KAF3085713.1 hypothetical protein TWF706_011869 [Orbilia oligospora]KAF3100255.1 hypothetical protein TWF103_008276 [Orbilia oligospora]KAF3123831.1 hypothetical protein TWF594_002183 [Orbilia oligospora]KAF3136737.1 hypothetical protein TWF569_009366 [Orbilia oligospora]
MGDDLQRIAYCLSASSTFVSEMASHLIYANDGTLTEEVWDPESGETIKQEEVGDGVKDGAPAAYVWYSNGQGAEDYGDDFDEGIGAEERMVFSITPENKIIAFKYDYEEDDVWMDYNAGNVGTISVHPQSGLSAAINPDGLYLFFMNPSGGLQAAVRPGGEDWTLTNVFPAEAKIGTPLTASVSNEGVSLFYFSVDDTLHYLYRGHESGSWEDHRIDNIVVETPVTRFRASQDQETGMVEAYVLTNERLLRFSGTGESVDVGSVEKGILTKTNDAQNIRWISRGCRPYYFRVRYIVVYHYFVPRFRGICW